MFLSAPLFHNLHIFSAPFNPSFSYIFEPKVLLHDFCVINLCISLRGIFSSVGYHLRGCSRMGYFLRSVKGAWSQKFKRVNWNHNPIVKRLEAWLKLQDSGPLLG